MACEVSQPPVSSQVFSPLTLFECTVTNAQMLVDSMADRELLRALKVANSLHMHILGVLEPRYDRVCQRSDEHEDCQAKEAAGKCSGSDSACGHSAAVISAKMETSGVSLLLSNGAVAAVAAEDADTAAEDNFYGGYGGGGYSGSCDDDCQVIEEEFEATLGSAAAATGAASGSGCGGGGDSPTRKRPRRRTFQRRAPSSLDGDVSAELRSSPPAAGVGQLTPAHKLAAECKVAIRRAYKEIKGSGPHLFDFSLPFEDPANAQAAEQVISRAMQLQPALDIPAKLWWSQLCPVELARSEKLHRQRVLMRRLRSKDSKLVRRQKSFEIVAGGLTAEAFDKFRLILSRDYTSSDEEAGGGGGMLGDDDGVGGSGVCVRELAWESDEVKAMKRQLDEAYLESCASAKQAEQLRRIERDSGRVSGRPPPTDCPAWAMKF